MFINKFSENASKQGNNGYCWGNEDHKSRNEFYFKKKTLHNEKKGIIVLCEIFGQ